jgi:P27 family predicted phage terminase small subunit
MLREAKVLTDADLTAFELMATHYAVAWRAAEIIEKQSLLQKDIFGGVHKHPLLQVLRDNSRTFLAYAVEFGLTPSARSRIKVGMEEEKDPFEEFVESRL